MTHPHLFQEVTARSHSVRQASPFVCVCVCVCVCVQLALSQLDKLVPLNAIDFALISLSCFSLASVFLKTPESWFQLPYSLTATGEVLMTLV